jgi:phage gpG-like protein
MTMTDDEFYDQQKAKIEAQFQKIDNLKISDELADSMKSMVEMIYLLEMTPRMKEFLFEVGKK